MATGVVLGFTDVHRGVGDDTHNLFVNKHFHHGACLLPLPVSYVLVPAHHPHFCSFFFMAFHGFLCGKLGRTDNNVQFYS